MGKLVSSVVVAGMATFLFVACDSEPKSVEYFMKLSDKEIEKYTERCKELLLEEEKGKDPNEFLNNFVKNLEKDLKKKPNEQDKESPQNKDEAKTKKPKSKELIECENLGVAKMNKFFGF